MSDGSRPPARAGNPLHLVRGAQAETLLEAPGFRSAWANLHAGCPFATVYQSPDFARTWYSVYRAVQEPVLVYEGREGALSGLLLLARDRETGRLGHVGAHQAEYQGWLAHTQAPNFIIDALRLCRSSGLARELSFHFLAPDAPLEWIEAAQRDGVHTVVVQHYRGLTRLGVNSPANEPLSKKNRSRLSRLGRAGAVRFQQIQNRQQLEAVFSQVMAQYDLRQGAVADATPFHDDPNKREFYLSLIEKPGLLHATALFAGDTVVAAHLGPRDRQYVSLGLLSHSPFHAAQSPGKLLILLLGQLLGEQGHAVLDLTPGRGYKERFATHSDEVPSLRIFLSQVTRLRYHLLKGLTRLFKLGAGLMGQDPHLLATRIRGRLSRLSPALFPGTVGSIAKRFGRWFHSTQEFRIYRISVPAAGTVPTTLTSLMVNQLEDVLLYQPATPRETARSEFFRTALSRLEDGQSIFTHAQDGMLQHSSWLIPSALRVGSDWGHEIALEAPAAVLWDDYTHPSARGRGLHTSSLWARLEHVRTHQTARTAVIGVRANNAPSRHNIEKVGFSHFCSAFLKTRLGKQTRWVEISPG